MAAVHNNKAATFSSKIRNLNEFHNNIVNNSLAANNSGTEVVLALNFFSQELLNVLTAVSADESSLDSKSLDSALVRENSNSTALINEVNEACTLNENASLASIATDQHLNNKINTEYKEVNIFATANRLRIFPALNYATLYHSLLNLIDIVPAIQINQIAVGEALIKTFECLCPFLTEDLLESLPYTIALALTTFPKDLHKCIVDSLCKTLLPIALYSERTQGAFISNSVPSIIMLVLQHGNDTVFNVQLFECLLSLKRDLIQDVLCAIAYGAYKVRYHATNLLFRYWPKLNPNRSDRNIHYHVVCKNCIHSFIIKYVFIINNINLFIFSSKTRIM